MKKMLMFVLISMFIFTLNVQATLTSNNLELLDESPMLSKEYAIEKNRILYQENSYIETSIHYVDNEVVDIKDKMITESEYENSSSVLRSTCTVPGANDCWETASKKIAIAAWEVGTSLCPTYRIQVDNIWKTVPTVKSFDVIALRYNNFKVSGGVGYQYYKVNGEDFEIQYNPSGSNTKLFNNGIGTSMNIVDSVTSDLHLKLVVEGSVNVPPGADVNFGGSYQHATSSVTLAQSQNYTISSSGLGGVLAFNSSIIGRYDGMQGVGGVFYGHPCYVR